MKYHPRLYAVALFLFHCTFAQVDTSPGADELFARAREKAFRNQYDSARTLLGLALEKSPSYSDVRIFLARTFAWEGKNVEARKEIQFVLSQEPSHNEALSVSIDIEMWSGKHAEALVLCAGALRKYPNDEELLLKKTKILRELGRDDEAMIALAVLEDINPSRPEIPDIRSSIKSSSMRQGIAARGMYEWYSKVFTTANLFYLQYHRSTAVGTVIGRVNYRSREGKSGLQGEIDAYPRIMNGVYAFVNYGFAGSSTALFPDHRAGFELFFKLPSAFESSIGVRYLHFGSGSDITIITGTLGYYYKDYWFSIRPYITTNNVSFSRSINGTARWYYAGIAEEYFSAKAGAGFSPDERNYDPVNRNVYYLKAQSLGLEWQKPLGVYSLITIMFDFTNQELAFSPGEYVKAYSLAAGYSYKF